ncbi:MAG: protein kinase [Gemmatimonadaceae bacterium]|nr:protein kinase [Gemmatimonadaceae bacterium]
MEDVIGRGGMGTVLLGREVGLRRLVAVKVLAPTLAADEDFRQSFDREAQAVARLSHPNIVQIYTAGITSGALGLPYFIMQYVDSALDLDRWILKEHAPGEVRARWIGDASCCCALRGAYPWSPHRERQAFQRPRSKR